MGIDVGKRSNEINFIIRTEESKEAFVLNEKGEVEKLIFDVYTQCFDYNKSFIIKLFFVYTQKENSKVEDLSFFEIGTYEVSNKGFKETEPSDKTIPSTGNHSVTIGITNGFRSDLKLTMNKIKLNPGYYEITAMTDEKILGLYPFKVVK